MGTFWEENDREYVWKSTRKCMELHDGKIGNWEIKHFTISNDSYSWKNNIPLGDYIGLFYKNGIVMSNTPMETKTNLRIMYTAYGNVLIGGLGIGMILYALDMNPNVKSVTVLEKSSEVIELNHLEGRFSNKIKVIPTDVFTWKPEKGTRFDCIYMDIWSEINSDYYKKEMIPLKKKYCHYLVNKDESPNRFIECWAEEYAKHDIGF